MWVLEEIQIFIFKQETSQNTFQVYLTQENILRADMEKQHFHHMNAKMFCPSYLLQEDATEDGAATQQQGQQADKRHQHIEELPCIVFGWHNQKEN